MHSKDHLWIFRPLINDQCTRDTNSKMSNFPLLEIKIEKSYFLQVLNSVHSTFTLVFFLNTKIKTSSQGSL